MAASVRSFIVGTAGHIDHGKSALVLALTGTDPDRLKEEKERGITVDLGFAHMALGEDLEASFVDVPGHERFVRNMLAGAHGIDAVLLVVAADESVMPQTREHFEICRLLGIPRGLLALTKCDLADHETQELAEQELRELVAGSFLEGAPVVRVSARSGAGLPELVASLRSLALAASERPAAGPLRLPIDRAFSLRGFGTVVTGTLVSGGVAVGDEVELLPRARRVRVRGLHVHGAPVDRVAAGHRTAANLAGIEVHEVVRGDVLASPGALRASVLLDVRLSLLAGAAPLEEQQRLRVHAASAEALGRVRLLGPRQLAPGAEALAQLRLEAPLVAVRGDRLVLRSYSPAATIGGAVVLDPAPPKRRTADRAALERLAAARDEAEAVVSLVREAGARGVAREALCARLGWTAETLRLQLAGRQELLALGGDEAWIAREALGALQERARGVLRRFHAQHPLKEAMPREELRHAFAHAAPAAFERVIADLATAAELRLTADSVALARHAVRLSADEDAARGALSEALRSAGIAGVVAAELARERGAAPALYERVARVLLASGEVRRVGEARLVATDRLVELAQEVRSRWPPGSRLDVGALKDLLGLTRKYVIPLLEYLDRERVTRRVGNDRFVLP
jgi:selenocysteine-specific elongation factor